MYHFDRQDVSLQQRRQEPKNDQNGRQSIIFPYRRGGQSLREISKTLNLPSATVSRVILRTIAPYLPQSPNYSHKNEKINPQGLCGSSNTASLLGSVITPFSLICQARYTAFRKLRRCLSACFKTTNFCCLCCIYRWYTFKRETGTVFSYYIQYLLFFRSL